MLRIKYFENFLSDEPYIVVICDNQGLQKASDSFASQDGAFLNDPSITEYSHITPLQQESLYLSPSECRNIARHFQQLSKSNTPGHSYFDIEALGDEIEVIIYSGEYENLF